MSNWRGRKGSSTHSYKQNANRLRDVLESRNQPEDVEQGGEGSNVTVGPQPSARHPKGLKGREIGMWYARRSTQNNISGREPSDRMVSLRIKSSAQFLEFLLSACRAMRFTPVG